MAKRSNALPNDYRDFFAGNSQFFKHVDIPGIGLGAEMVVTIDDVEPGTVGEGKDAKDQAILTFEGVEKKFGCNRTNSDTIALLYGANPRAWIGKAITLFRDRTKNKQGQTVECVRIRMVPPRGAKRAAPKRKAVPIKGKIR